MTMDDEPGERTVPIIGGVDGDDLERPALLAPGRSALTYGALVDQVASTVARLREMGVGPDHRVALVVPNGPEAASAFLGIAAACACAPLNPAYLEPELRFFLGDLRPSALVVGVGVESAARELGAELGIPTLELHADLGAAAGVFELDSASSTGAEVRTTTVPSAPKPDDVALMLHTSGTTNRPKLVPLTHANLAASAHSIARTLELTPDDRCLNLMPLFHIHGLVAALLASLVARGATICTPGFRGADVAAWAGELEPTWYTAVPTIHQGMLRCAEEHPDLRSRFRFVRSSSAALPVPVYDALERTFGAPVIEAYGMTEAAHQMASNPLPPAVRKPGTVGLPAGPDVAVMDDAGQLVPSGDSGEIVIRGADVTAGYVDNPDANATAFTDGWFRTGDRGLFDPDGYLTITGRIKEIINRGGEKIAPREVEDVLLAHRDVAEAIVFAAPHASLGEDVAAAVILRPDAKVSHGELRKFVAERLAPFKVPRRILFVDEIPKGATGKVQRIGLASRLGLAIGGRVAEPAVEPRDETEARLAALYAEILEVDAPVGATDDFLDLGADSLHIEELLAAIEDEFHRRLPATQFVESASVEALAAMLRDDVHWRDRVRLVPVQGGSRPPLYCAMRASSLVLTRNFRDALGPEQPIVGLWMPALHGSHEALGTIEQAAAECLDAVRHAQPSGPYLLFGYSAGGIVVHEMAHQLMASGERVALLALADATFPTPLPTMRSRLHTLFSRNGPAAVARKAREFVDRRRKTSRDTAAPALPASITDTSEPADLEEALLRERRWQAKPIDAPVVLFRTRESIETTGSPFLGWEKTGVDGWVVYDVPGSHLTMLGEPHVRTLAAKLADALRDTESGGS